MVDWGNQFFYVIHEDLKNIVYGCDQADLGFAQLSNTWKNMFAAFAACNNYGSGNSAYLNYASTCGYGIFDFTTDITCNYAQVLFDNLDITDYVH